jgi:glucose uptake protein GlcU
MAGDMGVGLLCCSIAGIGFGTNFLPVKKLDVADGVFFSFCMSLGIIIVGVIVSFAFPTESTQPFKGLPEFHPFAMLGGAVWMVGNLMCPLIIKWIGLGIGLTVWDLTNMLMGWATGRFGLFHLKVETVDDESMNYAGLALATASLFLFAQARDLPEQALNDREKAGSGVADGVDTESGTGARNHAREMSAAESSRATSSRAPSSRAPEVVPEAHTAPEVASSKTASSRASSRTQAIASAPVVAPRRSPISQAITATSAATSAASELIIRGAERAFTARDFNGWTCQVPGQVRFLVGFLMAMVAGAFMGYTFTPAEILAQTEGNSSDALDYVWSNYVGIVLAGNVALVVYVLIRNEKAQLQRANVFPALLSGAIWSAAQTAWFKANEELSMVIAFPIISSLPGVIALLIGVIFLGELETTRARFFAAAGIAVRLTGIALIALSNCAGP